MSTWYNLSGSSIQGWGVYDFCDILGPTFSCKVLAVGSHFEFLLDFFCVSQTALMLYPAQYLSSASDSVRKVVSLSPTAGVTVENIPPTKLYPRYVLAYDRMPYYTPLMDDWCAET